MKVDVLKIAQAQDPRAAILDATAKAVEGIDLFRNRVIVGTYVEPEKTAGGIIRPTRNVEEVRFQGKVGLVLKKGPAAFKFDEKMDIANPSVEPEVGEWVVYFPNDGREVSINGVSCRFIEDHNVVGRIADPSVIY